MVHLAVPSLKFQEPMSRLFDGHRLSGSLPIMIIRGAAIPRIYGFLLRPKMDLIFRVDIAIILVMEGVINQRLPIANQRQLPASRAILASFLASEVPFPTRLRIGALDRPTHGGLPLLLASGRGITQPEAIPDMIDNRLAGQVGELVPGTLGTPGRKVRRVFFRRPLLP